MSRKITPSQKSGRECLVEFVCVCVRLELFFSGEVWIRVNGFIERIDLYILFLTL